MNNLIPVQSSYTTQRMNEHQNKWIVYSSLDEKLGEFREEFTAHDIAAIMDFARKYELEALNIGVQFGKKEANRVVKGQIAFLNKELAAANERNDFLAVALQKELDKETV